MAPDCPFPATMRLGFDPADCDCLATSAVFTDEIATTLYLLWRSGHIVSQHFSTKVLQIALDIRKRRPKTVEELFDCFRHRFDPYCEFCNGDVRRFCETALPYFVGEKSIDYVVVDQEHE